MSKVEKIPVTPGKGTAPTMLRPRHPASEFEQLFEDFFKGWPSLSHWSPPYFGSMFREEPFRLPKLDIIDRDNEVVVRAEVPGIDKKDIDISLTDNLLTIKGESSKESKEEKGDYHRHEISTSSFCRSVSLPGMVDASKAAASLKDGVLEVTLPKLESSKRRTIAVE